MKDSFKTLIAFLLTQFLNQNKSEDYLSRFDKITKSFQSLLEKNYVLLKRPSEYANLLNISTPYLNQCVKSSTDMSVSQVIHERIVLEAKRLLYQTDKSVKEIAFDLRYTDYRYFTRLFRKLTGFSALTFRSRNCE